MKENVRTIEPDAYACRVDVQVAEGVTGAPAQADLVRWASAALRLGERSAEMCVRIVDEAEIRALNEHYRKRDEITNVLSFPCEYEDEDGVRLQGDVVICAPRVASEAREQGKEIEAHWAHLVMHGTLHLLGFDHQDDVDSERMEGIETELLAALGYADPYAIVEQGPDRA